MVEQEPKCTVPCYLQKPLNDWLQQEVKYNIFEKDPDRGTITLCSLPIIPPKPKFTDVTSEELVSHVNRATIDL